MYPSKGFCAGVMQPSLLEDSWQEDFATMGVILYNILCQFRRAAGTYLLQLVA